MDTADIGSHDCNNNNNNNNNNNPDNILSGRNHIEQLKVTGTIPTSFRQIMRSEKCVERVSCRMAAAERPNVLLIWLSW